MSYMEQQMQNYLEAGISEANRCYTRIAELEEQNADLVAERDALAARIQAAERVEKIFSETPELVFDDCLKLFADEIREIEAEAAYSGYVAGWSFQQKPLEPAATQYAERVKRGEQ